MKFKTTKKAMRENYTKIIKIGYGDAQYLLKFENEIAYSNCGQAGRARFLFGLQWICHIAHPNINNFNSYVNQV